MPKAHFTVAEVNRQVPRLEASFRRLIQIRTQLKSLYRRLDERGHAPGDEHFKVDIPGAAAEVLRDRGLFKALVETLRDELRAVRATGCVVKDIERGLVDWPANKDGREIRLCWRLGEKQVEYWHDADTGFAARRPVAELEPQNLRD